MGFRLSFGFGPLRYSQRLGRTQAQRRNAAARAAARREERRRQRYLASPAGRAEQAAKAARVEENLAAVARRRDYWDRTVVVNAYDVHHKGGETTFKFRDHKHGDRIVTGVMSDAERPEFSGMRNGKQLTITFNADGSKIEGIA